MRCLEDYPDRMSFTEEDEKVEQVIDTKSSGSEDSYQSDEEINSGESFSGSAASSKSINIKNDHAERNNRKNNPKSQSCRLAASLRCGKFNRYYKAKNKSSKIHKQKKCKKPPEKNKMNSEKPPEIPKKGKRCLSGGKAKGKPPKEEDRDKLDSDDDSDNFYFGRISLGYFQKFKDKNGASTSNKWEEDYQNIIISNKEEKIIHDNLSEEMELLELQRWGKTDLVSPYKKRTADFEKAEGIKPDKL